MSITVGSEAITGSPFQLQVKERMRKSKGRKGLFRKRESSGTTIISCVGYPLGWYHSPLVLAKSGRHLPLRSANIHYYLFPPSVNHRLFSWLTVRNVLKAAVARSAFT